ncbi:MAG: response regulator [Peptococcaceae bacterium]|nr:response regulator [Peptococcaceae bacterium]
MRILVVDDERKIRNVIKSYLVQEGFEVGEADNGSAALARARNENWDLILLDLMMPSVDGWEVMRELRKESNIPVIVLTARGNEVAGFFRTLFFHLKSCLSISRYLSTLIPNH